MESQRFDTIVKALGSNGSRRRILRGLLVGAGALAHAAQREAAAAGRCLGEGWRACGRDRCIPADQQCCVCEGVYQAVASERNCRETCRAESDRALKTDFATVDGQAVLAQVAALPIQSWRYREEDTAIRHIGPMAQDFAAAFNVGDNDRFIHVVDGQGVALAAIQGLTQELRALQAANAALVARVADLEGREA